MFRIRSLPLGTVVLLLAFLVPATSSPLPGNATATNSTVANTTNITSSITTISAARIEDPTTTNALKEVAAIHWNETAEFFKNAKQPQQQAPQWMVNFVDFRKRLFLRTVEPVIVMLLGPVEDNSTIAVVEEGSVSSTRYSHRKNHTSQHHRQLGFLPNYVEDVNSFKETSMSFATLMMLFSLLLCVFLIFVSCFYHNQKTSPLFSSPRRHRLPKLVPPPLPVDGYFKWVKVCFFLSDEEIIHRIGYDALIFLRFHRLALRCIVKMSVFSFVVLLPLNFTGGGHANAKDLKGYVGSLFFTDFLRFTMANVSGGSPRLWVHCFAAYLLTAIVVRELLIEYEAFNSIRHTYLLSREPHLRTVLVTNIPRHLRSRQKINSYFRHVYPQAVQQVVLCQNVLTLEQLVRQRTSVLSQLEKELLLLCRTEKYKLFQPEQQMTLTRKAIASCCRCSCWGPTNPAASWTMALPVFGQCLEKLHLVPGTQERLTRLYTMLEALNQDIEQEQRRRRRVMKMLDRMEAGGEGSKDIDYLLALSSPYSNNTTKNRLGLVLGGKSAKTTTAPAAPLTPTPEHPNDTSNASSSGGLPVVPPPPPPPPPPKQSALDADDGEPHEEPMPTGSTDSVLRARSPIHPSASNASTAPDITSSDDSEQKREASMSSKARMKMQRFSRMLSPKSNSSQSNAIAVAAAEAAADYVSAPNDLGHGNSSRKKSPPASAHIEDHLNEVSDKAFVVMQTFTAATIAIQSMHSSRPGSMQVSTAPEPRDILWPNIYISKGATRTRSYIGEVVVLLIITFYVVPIALVSLLVSESALVSSSPRLEQLDQASAFFSSSIAMVQPLCIVGIQQLLPPLFMAIGRAEGLVSFSEVQMRAFSRYFLFQVLNVFLVTTIAGSIFDTIAIIVENPEGAFEMLGNSLPRMSSFFITFVTIKTFLGLGLELVRTMSLVQATFRYLLFPNATLRTQRTVLLGMRAIDDPGWFPFHKILAQDMLVVVVSIVFAVVAPLVLLPCALFCTFSRIMWTHHHLYVYESVFESGGMFWPKIFRRFVFGLIIAQMTITGQFILKEARHEAYATIALMFMTYLFLRSTRARYDPTSSTLPLEVATVMDIRLHQEQQMEAAAAEAAAQRSGEGPRTAPQAHARNEFVNSGPNNAAPGPSLPDLGTRIGRYDPFENAYVQPALRAAPRARPEQPFPPAQLGREDITTTYSQAVAAASGVAAGASGLVPEHRKQPQSDPRVFDSGGRVRLKGLHQRDRHNLNNWWNEQLEKAGEQDILKILMGEECGTLTITEHDYHAIPPPAIAAGRNGKGTHEVV